MEERKKNVTPFKPAWKADTRQTSSHMAVLVKKKTRKAKVSEKGYFRFWSTSKRKRWKKERGKVLFCLSPQEGRKNQLSLLVASLGVGWGGYSKETYSSTA